MADETPVETTQAGGTATGAPVETPSPAVPATTPKTYTEDEVKAAREQARREAQSAAQKAEAKLHQTYQQQLAQQKQQGRGQTAEILRHSGVKDPDAILNTVGVYEKAQAYDQWQAQQQQAQAWNQYVAEQAVAATLDPSDPRIQGATDYIDLGKKIVAAVKADERAALQAERESVAAREKARLEAVAQGGALDTLGASPAGGAPGPQEKLERARKELKTLLNTPGKKDLKRVAELQAIIRAG